MSEMIERVENAVLAILGEKNRDGIWFSRGEVGRAAIEAMREPTEAMIEAGDDCPIINYDGNDTRQVFQTMIDAALNEPQTA